MQEYTIREMSPGIRCRWVYDEHYETRGSYAYDSDAETKEAEDAELDGLRDGSLVALGCIVEWECVTERHEWHSCVGNGRIGAPEITKGPHWHETDSLWGIVIEPNDKALDEFARACMDLGEGA